MTEVCGTPPENEPEEGEEEPLLTDQYFLVWRGDR